MKIMMPIVGLLLAAGCKPETAPITPAPEAAPAQTTEAGTPASPTGTPSPQTSLPGIHGAPAASGHVSAQTDTKTLSGTVQEVIPARNYLYLKLESEGDTLWAAVLKADVSVGASVEVVGAALMRNFTGTSINRTFPEIWFGTLGAASTVAAPSPHIRPNDHRGCIDTGRRRAGTDQRLAVVARTPSSAGSCSQKSGQSA